jgi:hypothetical protein
VPAHRADGRTGRSVTRSLYGAIIVLAVLVTADHHAPGPAAAAVGLALTVAVVLGMEAYADVIGQEVELRRSLTRQERAEVLRSLLVVTGSAEAPLVFLVAAAFGLIPTDLAFTLAEALTLALMFAYGYHARRLEGLTVGAAVRTGLTVTGVGLLLSLGKGYIHF